MQVTSQENNDLENRVKKAIEATGLPTEIIATKVLTDYHWHVKNEFPYVDTENNRVRTLDIKTETTFLKNKEDTNLKLVWDTPKDAIHCELYIECKKSKKPWVFYLDTLTGADIFFRLDRMIEDMSTNTYNTVLEGLKQSVKDPKIIEDGKRPISIFTRIPAKFKNLNYKIALSHQIAFINSTEKDKKADQAKDEIYSAEMQIFKAPSYQEQKGKNEHLLYKNNIIIPIILFDGNMFGCYYDNQELCTPKIDYTRHLAHGLPDQKVPALIDVVTLEYFPKYLASITKELLTFPS